MPNHVTTRCTITGPAHDVARFRTECIRPVTKTDDLNGKSETWTTFDFEAVIPPPERMGDVRETGDLSFWMELFGLKTPEYFPLGEGEARNRLKAMGPERFAVSAANFALAWEMLEKHGAKSWYDWNIANWGTKWGAYSFSIEGDEPLVLKFNTAWSFPTPIFEKLVERYPTLTFDIVCFDEGWNFAGEGIFAAAGSTFTDGAEATDALYERVYGRPPVHEDDDVSA